jgi:hypothetical protein
MRIAEYAARFSTLSEFLEAIYAMLESNYRCEYVFKNALLDQGPATSLIAPRFAVYSELPVAHFTGRVDMLFCENTTMSFEIKSDIDDLDRLEDQIAMNQRLFDLNYVVCSRATLQAVRRIVRGSRVGVFVFDKAGFALALRAKSNAAFVDPDAIFGTIRHAERIEILRGGHREPDALAAERFDATREAFGLLSPSQAHDGLVQTLRNRPKLANNGYIFQELPRSMKHLFFQSKEAERNRLLGSRNLARSVR